MDIGAQRSKLKLKTPHKRWWIKNASSKETWQIEGSKDKEIVNVIFVENASFSLEISKGISRLFMKAEKIMIVIFVENTLVHQES